MYYVREVVEGQWKTYKLSDVEVDKLQRVTAKRAMKAILTVRDEIAKAKLETPLTPAETLVIVQKVAPSYEDTVHDWLRKQTWKGAAPVTTPSAPTAAPVEAATSK